MTVYEWLRNQEVTEKEIADFLCDLITYTGTDCQECPFRNKCGIGGDDFGRHRGTEEFLKMDEEYCFNPDKMWVDKIRMEVSGNEK